jgi:hypothetical protein
VRLKANIRESKQSRASRGSKGERIGRKKKRRREKEREKEEKKPVPCTVAPLCHVYRPAAGEARRRRRYF